MADPTESARFSWLVLLRALGRALLRLPNPVSFGLVVLWMGVIWMLSDRTFERPAEMGSDLWRIVSNLAHAPVFGLLALLIAGAVLRPARPDSPGSSGSLDSIGNAEPNWPRVSWRDVCLVVLLTTGYGAVDEWHQSHVPGRNPSVADLGTDAVGALAVLWIVGYLASRRATEAGVRRRLLAGIVSCAVVATAVAFVC